MYLYEIGIKDFINGRSARMPGNKQYMNGYNAAQKAFAFMR